MEFFINDREHAEGWIKDAEYAAQVLEVKSTVNIDTNRFVRGIGVVSIYPAVAPPRSVFDKLNATGKFSEISEDSVRSKIIEYYAYLDFIQSQLDCFRQTVNEPEDIAVEDFYAVYDPDVWSKRKWHFILENLFENTGFISSHVSGLRNLIAFNSFRRNGLKYAETMCVALAKASRIECSSRE